MLSQTPPQSCRYRGDGIPQIQDETADLAVERRGSFIQSLAEHGRRMHLLFGWTERVRHQGVLTCVPSRAPCPHEPCGDLSFDDLSFEVREPEVGSDGLVTSRVMLSSLSPEDDCALLVQIAWRQHHTEQVLVAVVLGQFQVAHLSGAVSRTPRAE